MRFPKTTCLSAALVAAAATVVEGFQCTRGQLYLVDHDKPRVAIYDLDAPNPYTDPTYLDSKHTRSPSWRLAYPSSSKQFVAVVHLNVWADNYPPTTDTPVGGVTFIDTGVRMAQDKNSVTKSGPKTLDFHIDCVFPAHYHVAGTRIGQWCDGSPSAESNATVWVVDETRLAAYTDTGSAPSPLLYTVTLDNSHHGLAAVMSEGDVAITQIDDEGTMTGVHIWDYTTVPATLKHDLNDPGDPTTHCHGFHFDSSSGNTWAFGCSEEHGGILVVRAGGGSPEYTSRILRYPEGYENHRANGMMSHPANSYFVAVFSSSNHSNLLAFDPVHGPDQLTAEQVQPHPGVMCSGDSLFEQSAGQLFFAWLSTGVLQVYAVNPWALVSEIQVIDGMTECGLIAFIAGYGYAYVHAGNTLYEVDVRDTAAIKLVSYEIDTASHNGPHLPISVVAGVPLGMECMPGPTVPQVPPASRSGETAFVNLHFKSGANEANLVPGSTAQAAFIRKFRHDIGQALHVGIDRIYIKEFRHLAGGLIASSHLDPHDKYVVVEIFFANAGPHDVNKENAEFLKNKFTDLVANEELSGTLAFVKGSAASEPEDAQGTQENNWPTGAKVVVGVFGGLFVVAAVAAAIFLKKGQEYAKEKAKAIRAAEESIEGGDETLKESVMDNAKGVEHTAYA